MGNLEIKVDDLDVNTLKTVTIDFKKLIEIVSKEVVKTIIDYSWNPSVCIYENDRYLKPFVDDSVIGV